MHVSLTSHITDTTLLLMHVVNTGVSVAGVSLLMIWNKMGFAHESPNQRLPVRLTKKVAGEIASLCSMFCKFVTRSCNLPRRRMYNLCSTAEIAMHEAATFSLVYADCTALA